MELFIYALMGITLVAGASMLIFTMGYRKFLRKTEVFGRIALALLAVHSVITRVLSMMPGCRVNIEIAYPAFDVLYIVLFVVFNMNVLRRKREGNGKRTSGA